MPCSPCITATGFVPSCKPSAPGVRTKIYLTPLCNVDTFTRLPYSNIVDSITLVGGATFYEVTARQQSVNFTEAPNGTSGSLLPQLTFILDSLSDNADKDVARQEMLDFVGSILANSEGLVGIIVEGNGVRRVVGLESGLFYSDGTNLDTGTARTDQTNNTIVLQGVSSEPSPVLDSAFTIPV